MRPPTSFECELALDRLDARLAAELPGHVAALARAYADGAAGPAPIAISTREIEAVLAARRFDEHRTRATRVLRVIAPIVIDGAPAVIAAYARERTWANWRALAAARDEQARMRFGISHRALVHALAGLSEWLRETDHSSVRVAPNTRGEIASRNADVEVRPRAAKIPAPIDGWNRVGISMTDEIVGEIWAGLAENCGGLTIVRSRAAHPRTFVVERGAHATIVIPARVETCATRFAVLHELGHARLWLAPVSLRHEWPRAVDEAIASFVARAMETESPVARHLAMTDDDHRLARSARERRTVIARVLDAIEAGGDTSEIATVPGALWDDPHAQAAYLAAERIADDLTRVAGNDVAAAIEHVVALANATDIRAW